MKHHPMPRIALKLALDALMLAVLMLLFRKQSISLAFHEIAGLALLGAFVVHLLLNAAWICRVTQRIFAKGTPGRTRLCWAVNALLAIGFGAIGLSGILISKVVFSFHADRIWTTVHYFSAACTLILMGVHLGLHAPLLGGVLRKHGLCGKGLRRVGAAAATAVVVFGCYSMTVTSFPRWLSMPFTAAAMGGHEDGAGIGEGQWPSSAAENPAGAAEGGDHTNGTAEGGGKRTGPQDGTGKGAGQSVGGSLGGSHQQGGLLPALETFAQFFSIAFAFACLTAMMDWLHRRKKDSLPAIS